MEGLFEVERLKIFAKKNYNTILAWNDPRKNPDPGGRKFSDIPNPGDKNSETQKISFPGIFGIFYSRFFRGFHIPIPGISGFPGFLSSSK